MTDTTKQKDARTVTLKGMRFSYMEGLKTKQKSSDSEDAKPKHSWNLINEKDRPHFAENEAKIKSALAAAGLKKWKDEDAWTKIAEDNPKRVTYKKGEKFKNKEGKIYAGYEGNTAFGVSGPDGGQKRPRLFDKYKRPVAEDDIEDVFYGGCYGDVIVSFYGTDKGSRGIFATCELLRSHQTGEHMGGGYSFSQDDLDELDDLGEIGDDLDGDIGGGNATADDDLLG